MSTPTAYTTGGGGFFTMTSSMGIIRAWHESNLLNDTTHFGGGSGGTWFQLQFSFSKDFYESAIGLNGDTVPDFLTAWGTSYGESMVAASESGLFEEILEFTLATSSNKCVLDGLDVGNLTAADIITGALREALESLYFPANNWYFYINEMLGTYIPDAETVDFSTERKGFPKGTIVIGSTLGPDIYQNDPSSKSPKLIGAPAGVTLLPISYVAPADSDGSWDFKGVSESDIEVSIHGNSTRVPFTAIAPNQQSLTDVASGSSSFLGLTGSPTLFKNTIGSFLKDQTNLTLPVRTAVQAAFKLCLPLGLQNTSSPTNGNTKSTLTSWSPAYRYIDAGYSEGSSITHTVASMQQSCINQPLKYDCSTVGLRLLNIVGNNAQSTVSGQQKGIPRLFANCDCGTTNRESIGESPDPQIFEQDFPTDLTDDRLWHLYSNAVYTFGNNTQSSKSYATNSYALRMNLTTVKNTAYGVTGGMPIEVIILFPDLPPQEKVIWPGYEANYAFSTIYAETAQEQYASVLQIFETWDLANEWGPTPTPSSTSDAGRAITFVAFLILSISMLVQMIGLEGQM